MIVKHLRRIQDQHGYLPAEELKALARRIGEPLHRLNEVATFFPVFRSAPPPQVDVKVCRDIACHLRGAGPCFEAMESVAKEFGVSVPPVAADGEGGLDGIATLRRPRVRVEWVSCLGRCDQAPSVLVELHSPGRPDQCRMLGSPGVPDYASRLREVAGAHLIGDSPSDDPVDRSPVPWRIDPYRPAAEDASTESGSAGPGEESFAPYEAIRRLAEEWKRAGSKEGREGAEARFLDMLAASTLRGMGGAGVLVARKWGDVRAVNGGEKYVICNADESEPATFKDREILLRAPHLVVEGMALAALLTGATRGYVYIRHEYHDQIHAIDREIARGAAMGVVGPDLLGTGRSFALEVFESPGGYVCGEQSALVEAIEDRRAEPRNKPPQLETNGLRDCPTVVNNVESFAWVPAIALRGGGWYAGAGGGGPGLKGFRLFSLCGDAERPGVYEVAIGASFRSLVEMAGGVRGGRALKAVAFSGPSGGFVPARLGRVDAPEESHRHLPEGDATLDVLDLPLDLDRFRQLGLMLGAGIMLVAEPREGDPPGPDTINLALNATRFFRNESCGKCVPCRIGSQKLVQIAEAIDRARDTGDERDFIAYRATVADLRLAMESTSICGLGMAAPNPLSSVLQSFWGDLGLRRPIPRP